MSGWDASSRPKWDSEGGDGDTDAFPVPDYAETTGDGWPEPRASSAGSGYAGRRQPATDDQQPAQRSSRDGSGGYGYESGPAGAPPEIFQRDYGQQDPGQRDFGERDRSGLGYGQETRAQRGYSPWEAAGQDDARRGYAPRDYTQPGTARDFPSWDFAPADRADADDVSRDNASPIGNGRAADPDRASRIDPALQDFFTAQPSRADAAQPGSSQKYGENGAAGQGAGQAPRGSGGGQPAGGPQPRQPSPRSQLGQLVQPAQPGRPPQSARPNWWDAPITRGFFALREDKRRSPRRNLIIGAVLAVVVLVIALIEVLLGHGKAPVASSGANPISTATSKPTAVSTPSSSAKASTAGKPAARKAGYTLTTPATAGGFPMLTPVPADVQSAAGTTSQAIRGAAVNSGGKVTSQVSAAYQLSGGQVLAFTGYEGTFNPAKVIASLASLGTGGQTYAPGKHGGRLACATAPGTSSGTVCVWATTTTVGITEFFGSIGPEVVTVQSKAAVDAVKLRNSVEAPKP